MKPLLLLIDLQNDYLAAPGLEPAASEIVRNAALLLESARARGVPVIHVQTAVDLESDDRMPHWRELDRRICVRGTPGQEAPRDLAPRPGEPVVSKTFFSGFASPRLEEEIHRAGADTLWLAGVHLHACVRTTALDAYQRGFAVRVAEDAVGSDDPLHAAVTRRYLDGRAARFETGAGLLSGAGSAAGEDRSDAVPSMPAAVVDGREVPPGPGRSPIHRSPRDLRRALFAVPDADPDAVAEAVRRAGCARLQWARSSLEERARILGELARRLEASAEILARDLAIDVGKPVAEARAEVRRAAELLRSDPIDAGALARPVGTETRWRRMPVGVVALVTPWNNPIGIPLGKIGAALRLGNAVVWKPAPAAARISVRLLALAGEAGLPAGVVNLVSGGHRAARTLLSEEGIDAISLSGSAAAGWAAQEIAARRRVPFQAELGGNNAAIVAESADVSEAAGAIARGAFSFAGQRCTANRRAVVDDRIHDAFLEAVAAATASLVWGDPLDPVTEVGPVVSRESKERIATAIERARAGGARITAPHASLPHGHAHGAYAPPAIVDGAPAASEIVQEETFGPVLVVQRARGFENALELAHGVRQGLVSALFSRDASERETFLARARAGLLKINRPTTGTDAFAPFGGWRASGVGPPERGPGDVEFYTRVQTLSGEI